MARPSDTSTRPGGSSGLCRRRYPTVGSQDPSRQQCEQELTFGRVWGRPKPSIIGNKAPSYDGTRVAQGGRTPSNGSERHPNDDPRRPSARPRRAPLHPLHRRLLWLGRYRRPPPRRCKLQYSKRFEREHQHGQRSDRRRHLRQVRRADVRGAQLHGAAHARPASVFGVSQLVPAASQLPLRRDHHLRRFSGDAAGRAVQFGRSSRSARATKQAPLQSAQAKQARMPARRVRHPPRQGVKAPMTAPHGAAAVTMGSRGASPSVRPGPARAPSTSAARPTLRP